MGITRTTTVEWKGDLMSGEGFIRLGSKAYEGPYSFKSRTADQSPQTNPEELLGAAHAGCFSMQLSALLSKAGHAPEAINTIAKVHLDKEGEGFVISKIELETSGKVPGITADEFLKYAETAKTICPISKALASTKIEFNAILL
jgi:lipoyl-dependent peroxiredoxin